MIATAYSDILKKIDRIDPRAYGKSRNFINGAVSQLSPYVSRGVISTRQIHESLQNRKIPYAAIEKLLQQLTWRDYFQRTAQKFPNLSEQNVKNDPSHFKSTGIPSAMLNADIGIDALDEGIDQLLQTGWIHNHMRMYLSMLHTNVGRCDWRSGARWMYYHLLDADMASNDLSWQWVCGANSSKLYVANQENINRYADSKQRGSFLDIDYEDFDSLPIPAALQSRESLVLEPTNIHIRKRKMDWSILFSGEVQPNASNQVALYSWNNLDPNWRQETNYRRILLLDSDEFERRPISERTLEFVIALTKNIPGLEVVYGRFSELALQLPNHSFTFKEHPTQIGWKGLEDPRDWIFPEVTQYTPSFFGFWKKCEKYLKTY